MKCRALCRCPNIDHATGQPLINQDPVPATLIAPGQLVIEYEDDGVQVHAWSSEHGLAGVGYDQKSALANLHNHLAYETGYDRGLEDAATGGK